MNQPQRNLRSEDEPETVPRAMPSDSWFEVSMIDIRKLLEEREAGEREAKLADKLDQLISEDE